MAAASVSLLRYPGVVVEADTPSAGGNPLNWGMDAQQAIQKTRAASMGLLADKFLGHTLVPVST